MSARESAPVALLCGLAILAMSASVARAENTIAAWNFNEGMTAEVRNAWPGPIPASAGSGQIVMSAFGGATEDFEGTPLNALPGDAAGASLTLVAGKAVSGNGTYVSVEFSTEHLEDIDVSFATRGTFFGFGEGQWWYSTDGASFTQVGHNTASNLPDWRVETIDLTQIDEIENQPRVFLRYYGDGAMATASNNRIDNLMVVAHGCLADQDPVDRDCDHIPDLEDLCPDYPSTNEDVDENGIGDECECGDQNGDGIVNLDDILEMNRLIFGRGVATPLCDTNQDGTCDVLDIMGANRKIFGGEAYCSRYPSPAALR